MTKFSTLIILFFSVIFVNAAEPIDSIYEEDPYFLLMGEADQAIAKENWIEAAARLNDALAVKPNHPSNVLLLNNLASVYVCLEQDSLALSTYNRALDIAPSMVTVLNGKGRLLLKLGCDADAYRTFESAIAVDSLSTTARFYHGMLALYGGAQAIAEQDFEVLKSIAPNSLDTSIALGTLYSLTGRERDAIPYLRSIIKLEPSPEYYASLAECYLALDELTDASFTLSDAMKLYPNDPELYYYRAWLNRDRYLYDDAKADAKRAIELGASPAKVNALFAK